MKRNKIKLLEGLKIGFFIPLILIILAIITSYVFEWLMIGGFLFLIGFIGLEIFMISFWGLNLMMMYKWERWSYFIFSIIFPAISLVFYIREFYPFLKWGIKNGR